MERGRGARVGLRPHLKVPRYPFSPLRAIATKDVSMRIEGDESMAYIVYVEQREGRTVVCMGPDPLGSKGRRR